MSAPEGAEERGTRKLVRCPSRASITVPVSSRPSAASTWAASRTSAVPSGRMAPFPWGACSGPTQAISYSLPVRPMGPPAPCSSPTRENHAGRHENDDARHRSRRAGRPGREPPWAMATAVDECSRSWPTDVPSMWCDRHARPKPADTLPVRHAHIGTGKSGVSIGVVFRRRGAHLVRLERGTPRGGLAMTRRTPMICLGPTVTLFGTSAMAQGSPPVTTLLDIEKSMQSEPLATTSASTSPSMVPKDVCCWRASDRSTSRKQQRFMLEGNPSSGYTIHPRDRTDLCLDIHGGDIDKPNTSSRSINAMRRPY